MFLYQCVCVYLNKGYPGTDSRSFALPTSPIVSTMLNYYQYDGQLILFWRPLLLVPYHLTFLRFILLLSFWLSYLYLLLLSSK